MKEYMEIGQIVNVTGLKGMMKVNPFTDDITRFEDLEEIYIEYDKELIVFSIEKVGYQKRQVLLKLKNIDTIEDAEKYRNCYLKINRKDAVKLPKDTYFISDLIDIEVYTLEGDKLGKIEDIFSTGSNDVYVVKQESGKQILLPAIADVIRKVDLQKKRIDVKLLEGLL